ncbi:MltA domain-containing protein [Shigella flexneri]
MSENYVLAYSNSLMDNFIMDVQGSGGISILATARRCNFLLSYAGKNGHAYRSIGKARSTVVK